MIFKHIFETIYSDFIVDFYRSDNRGKICFGFILRNQNTKLASGYNFYDLQDTIDYVNNFFKR